MASCPQCGTQVNVDFGMATCPNASCALVFMVGIDGTAQMPDMNDYSSGEEEAPAETQVHTEIHEEVPSDFSAGETAVGEYAPTYVGSDDSINEENLQGYSGGATEVISDVYGDAESAAATENSSDEFAESTELYQTSGAIGETEYDENFLQHGFDQPEEVQAPEPDDPKDPMGIQRYDRNPASQLVDGPYYYDLYISGLDTAQIKDEVMSALNDKRFQWSADDIRRKLRNGRLIFKDLNPVKAVLIVIKLQHVDVEIQWVQKLHTDPSVTGGVPGQA